MVAPHSTPPQDVASAEDLFINDPTSNTVPYQNSPDEKPLGKEGDSNLDEKTRFSDEASFEKKGVEHEEPIVTTGEDVSRYVVSLRDDGETAFTFRSAVIGAGLTALAATVNQLYFFKPVSVDMSSVFIVLISYMVGQAWARVLPTRATVSRFPRLASLAPIVHFINPGPLTLKEHAVSSIVATSASNGAAIVQVFAAENLFYSVKQHTATAVLGTLSASLFGYGLCGILRPVCVFPSSLVYWTQLPMVSMYQTFHHDQSDNNKRLKLFGWTFGAFAFWEPIASYIFPTLNGISIPCLASQKAPSSTRAHVNRLFGGANNNQGLGILSLSFDWQYITSKFVSLPLIQQANSWAGIFICYVMVIALYYSDHWGAKSLPMLSTGIFTEAGNTWNQKLVFGSVNPHLNVEALERYGLPRMTASYIWANMCQCLAIGALIAHVVLFWGDDMKKAWKDSRDKTVLDPHWVAMQKYKEVPHWWYLICLVLGAVFGIVSIAVGQTTLTIWGYIVALLLGVVIAPLSCFLYGVMGTGVSTNAISKMVSGAILPGRPLANLYFATYSHEVIVLVVNLSGDLKLGQYLKIPPRTMFLTQVFGTILGSFINYAVMISVVKNKRDLLIGKGNNVWSGAAIQSLNSQAVTWSLASRVYGFGRGGYGWVPVGLAFGALLPIAHWLILKKWKRLGSIQLNQVCLPVILQFASSVTSGVTSTRLSCILVGIVSQVVVRRRYPAIFRKYAYILGGAADGGSQVIIFIFSFALLGAAGNSVDFPTWAGNPTGNVDHCAAK